jgi:hypothetical protein
MKRFTILAIMLTLLHLCFSHASDTPTSMWNPEAPSPFKYPPVMSELLKDYRQIWVRLTGLEPSGLHWNQRVVVYINKHDEVYKNNHTIYRKSLSDDDDDKDAQRFAPYPYGTVLLKENYILDQRGTLKPASVTMMMKYEKDYDPAMGDWHFVQFDPAGNMIINGSSQNPGVNVLCASCHHNIAPRDYVFATKYSHQKGVQ